MDLEENTAGLTPSDFEVQKLGECRIPAPFEQTPDFYRRVDERVVFQNSVSPQEDFRGELLSFAKPGPHRQIFFDPTHINVGIVTCGGLCPGLNDVIRAIGYCALNTYNVKNVYGFRHGYRGLTAAYSHTAISLTPEMIDNIHERGGTILGSSRGEQPVEDMVDTLVKFNISILFTIGGDGTHRGAVRIAEEIARRRLPVAVIGIPKTIDNDISFVHRTFGFATAVEESRHAVNAAHVEARGAPNGIGLVRLMGRNAGFITAHATLASGNVNICLIPEEPFSLEALYARIRRRFVERKKDHLVIAVAEGVGQELLVHEKDREYDDSGNPKIKDIGVYLKYKISEFLEREGIEPSMKYIDPSYMIRSTQANASDSRFCLQLGTYAVHAGMAGRTNALVGYWNQHFTLVPIPLAMAQKKRVDIDGEMWRSVVEITN